MSQKRQRGISATLHGIHLLQQAKANSPNGPLSYEAIAEGAQVSGKTVGRFFNGKDVDKSSAYAIIEFFKLSVEDVLSLEAVAVGESIKRIEDENTTNSERAIELIEGLESALSQLKNREKLDAQCMDWLKANRQSLAQEAAEHVLIQHSVQESSDRDINDSELEQFSEEIRKYLQLVHSCLEVGDWGVIDGAVGDSSIPVNRGSDFYKKALTFIRDQRMKLELPPDTSQSLSLCLDYLIAILPTRF